MSDVATGTPTRCAPVGWRPTREDDESRKMAADLLTRDLSEWLEASTGRTWTAESVVAMLLDAAPREVDLDGYSLARAFEKFAVEPDTRLVDILDQWSESLEAATRKREQDEAARLGIEPNFGTVAAALFHAPEGAPLVGTVFRIPEDKLGRCAFVPAEGMLDKESGDLVVLSVGLEDVEVVGPPTTGADSLHVSALAAVDAYDNEQLMEKLASQADLDIGMFDRDVTGIVVEREAAGANHLAAHFELLSYLADAAQRAMGEDDFKRTWVAALMCAAAARRIAMLAGAVPDAAETSDLVVDLSSAGEDDVASLAGAKAVPAVRMLN